MGLYDVPTSERVRIGFFGATNVGKSRLINAITGQNVSIVSDVNGTTTDPVKKSMEMLPLGPVCIIDTPGIDDNGELGQKRIEKTYEMLYKTDLAVLVCDSDGSLKQATFEKQLKNMFKEENIPYIVVHNKMDLIPDKIRDIIFADVQENEIFVSASTGENINELREKIAQMAPKKMVKKSLVGDFIVKGDIVVMVTPIDEAAPKGRLILPQQLALRDILDNSAIPMLCQPAELPALLGSLSRKPKLVITDSQAFAEVAEMVNDNIPLTSFSILMAKYRGQLEPMIEGVKALKTIKDFDVILISEACTHHRQCNDIGTVKLPAMISEYSKATPRFLFSSGEDFPIRDIVGLKLVVHCGGCMIGDKEMMYRIEQCENLGVPVVNYGVAIACMNGILDRALKPVVSLDERR